MERKNKRREEIERRRWLQNREIFEEEDGEEIGDAEEMRGRHRME